MDAAALSRRLVWLTGLRLGALTALLAAVIALYLGDRGQIGSFSTQLALATVALGYAGAAAVAVAIRLRRALVPAAYAQLLLEQAMWTAIAYVSGGVASGAASFYGLTCVVGAVVLGVRGVIVAACAAAAMFGAMGWGFASARLSPPIDQAPQTYATSAHDVSYYLALNLLAIAVVAALSGYLAERLHRAGGELERATTRAEEAEELARLGRLAAGLAHEIRNPLGSIAGSAQLLAAARGLSDEDKILCGIITSEAARLNDLVSDMVDLARPRRPELGPVDLAALARDVVRLAAQSGRGVDVAVRYSGPSDGVGVTADGAQLRQVVWNLVRNAVQASGAGETVRVSVEEAPGEVTLEVADHGAGIPEDARARMFEAFFTTRAHGVGVGLAVVKRIVDDHGFSIAVLDGEPKGARFVVTIPRARGEGEP
ncbi:MAG: two-component sensor histidine kinase [Polyangiaceae bacterium]|nr:two-component sensor histidine kinase [Polyangiaceae bacterium]